MYKKPFEIYKSSAGSGKTYTLVKSYLSLALQSDDARYFSKILAITFTNMAANEMKNRVIEALKSLGSGSKTTPLGTELCAILGISPEELRHRATQTLSQILHNYSEFAVSTIDAFVHRLVRSFARDLNFKQNFEIELDSGMLIEKAVDLLINQIGTNEFLSAVLVDYAKFKAEEDQFWDIQRDLEQFSRELFQENSRAFVEALSTYQPQDFMDLKAYLKTKISGFELSITEVAQAAIRSIEAAGLQKNDFWYAAAGIGNFFYAVNQMPDKEPGTRVTDTIAKNTWYSKATSIDIQAKIHQIKDGLEQHFERINHIQTQALPDYRLHVGLYKNLHALTVLSEINAQLKSYQESKNMVHISEFNHAISQNIALEPVPYIYERLGEKYNHFLIDEFQDTSVLQWQNLLPLIENSLSQNQYSMVVGDGKQAIYRFRGGEVAQIAELPQMYSPQPLNELQLTYENTLVQNSKELNLNTNYRSQKEIVAFNNGLFAFCEGFLDENTKKIYHKSAQEYLPNKQGGMVEISFFDKEIGSPAIYQKTLDSLEKLVEDGFLPADIVLLVRTTQQGNDLAQFLVAHGVEVISSDSLLLSRHKTIKFLLALMRIFLDATDPVAIAEVLYYIQMDLGQKELTEEKIAELIAAKKLTEIEKVLAQLGYFLDAKKTSKLPIYELVEQLLRCFGLQDTADAYLQAFLNLVLGFSQKENGNLYEFLDFWGEKSSHFSLTMPEGLQAVTIMTIHKSKGLQFPVVILPFCDWDTEKIKPSKYLWLNLDYNQELAVNLALLPANQLQKTEFVDQFDDEKNKTILDNLNILYVALTRPEQRLYLFSTKSESQSVYKWLRDYLAVLGIYQENKTVYQLGNADIYAPKRPTKTNDVRTTGFISTDWNERIALKQLAISLPNE